MYTYISENCRSAPASPSLVKSVIGGGIPRPLAMSPLSVSFNAGGGIQIGAGLLSSSGASAFEFPNKPQLTRPASSSNLAAAMLAAAPSSKMEAISRMEEKAAALNAQRPVSNGCNNQGTTTSGGVLAPVPVSAAKVEESVEKTLASVAPSKDFFKYNF